MKRPKPAAEKMLPKRHLPQLMVLLSTPQVIYTVPVDLNCLFKLKSLPAPPHTPFYINSCRKNLFHYPSYHGLLQSPGTRPQQGMSVPG